MCIRDRAIVKEQREIWKYILSQVGGEAHLFKLGTITDDSLGDKLRVTVVAAGFDSIESPISGIEGMPSPCLLYTSRCV